MCHKESQTAQYYGSPIGSVSAPGSALTDETTAGSAASTDSTDASTALALFLLLLLDY